MSERDPDFFKLHYRQWRQRMHKLRVPFDLQGALLSIVIETHLTGSAPPDDDYVLAGCMMVSPRKARAAADKLIARGLIRLQDGFLVDKTAVEDAAIRSEIRKGKAENGRKGGVRSGVSRGSHARLGDSSGNSGPTKPLETNKTGEALSSGGFELEESRVVPLTNVNGRQAAERPLDEIVFDQGLRFLMNAGIGEKPARSMLGKWRGQHGDEALLSALGRAQREGALDPVAFVQGCFRATKKNRSDANDRFARKMEVAKRLDERNEAEREVAGGEGRGVPKSLL